MAYSVHNFSTGDKLYASQLNQMDAQISENESIISGINNAVKGEYTIPITLTAGKYIDTRSLNVDWTTKLVANGSSSYTATAAFIPSNLIGKTARIYWTSHDSTSGRCFGFCDSSNKVVKWYGEDNITCQTDSIGTYVDVEIVSNYMYFSTKTVFGFIKAVCNYSKLEDLSNNSVGKIAYVSKSGSDTNSGESPSSAFSTINKALESGFDTIRVSGGNYLQKVDLSKSRGKVVSISAYERDKRPVFVDTSAIITTSNTVVDGYTRVKKATKSITTDSNTVWIYQDNSSDASTLISDDERHPLQRGKEYRCDDTKIVKCTSTVLSDALAEIESSDVYKWFKTGDDWYFSCPETVSSNKPICCGVGNSFFSGLDRGVTLRVSGIWVKYMSFNISGTVDSIIADCKCSNAKDAGAFRYDNCLNATFLRCEAEHCASGGNGDGFNGHASGAANDAFAKCVSCTHIDCWSHDNCDDGYSNHDRGEDTIIGGLYEYNGKAGITPSYGTHCTCYNVLSRRNYSGYYCIGAASESEGGKYTQLTCYNCIAYYNRRGGLLTGFYTEHTGNRMSLYNCKAIGNNRAYRAMEGTTMELIDCTVLENTGEVKYGTGTFAVKNTTAVTA